MNGRSTSIIGIDMARGAGRAIHNGKQEPLSEIVRGPVRVVYAQPEPPAPPKPGESCVTCGHATPVNVAWPGGVTYDWSLYELTGRGGVVPLTAIESKLVRELVRHPGVFVSFDSLVAAVWPAGWYSVRAAAMHCLRIHISRVRQKLRQRGFEGFIVTRPGVGYRTVVPLTEGRQAE